MRENTNYIDDYDAIKEIDSMFILCDYDSNAYEIGTNAYEIGIDTKTIVNKSVFREPLRKFLEDYNFIFVD